MRGAEDLGPGKSWEGRHLSFLNGWLMSPNLCWQYILHLIIQRKNCVSVKSSEAQNFGRDYIYIYIYIVKKNKAGHILKNRSQIQSNHLYCKWNSIALNSNWLGLNPKYIIHFYPYTHRIFVKWKQYHLPCRVFFFKIKYEVYNITWYSIYDSYNSITRRKY